MDKSQELDHVGNCANCNDCKVRQVCNIYQAFILNQIRYPGTVHCGVCGQKHDYPLFVEGKIQCPVFMVWTVRFDRTDAEQ